MTKLSYIFVILLVFIVPVMAVQDIATNSIQVGGTAGSIIHMSGYDTFLKAEDNYNSEYGKTHLITIGSANFDANTTSVSKYHNTMDSSISATFNNAALASTEYLMEDQRGAGGKYTTGVNRNESISQTYQAVNNKFTQMGAGGDFRAATIVDDTNVTSSLRGEGAYGSVSESHDTLVQQKFGADSTETNFQKHEFGRTIWTDKNESGFQGYFDQVYTDHRGAIQAANSTGNITTEGNSSTNLSQVS